MCRHPICKESHLYLIDPKTVSFLYLCALKLAKCGLKLVNCPGMQTSVSASQVIRLYHYLINPKNVEFLYLRALNLVNCPLQSSVSASQVIRLYRYLLDARFFDAFTKTVVFEAVTFNAQLQAFGSWRLSLRRGSSGVFQGTHTFNEVAIVTVKGISEGGGSGTWWRTVTDAALLGVCAMNLVFIVRDIMPAASALPVVRLLSRDTDRNRLFNITRPWLKFRDCFLYLFLLMENSFDPLVYVSAFARTRRVLCAMNLVFVVRDTMPAASANPGPLCCRHRKSCSQT